jgi:hypothetical protein
MYPPKLEQEQQARELFLTSQKSRTEIAEQVGVSEKTISRWSVKGGWTALKKASVQAPAVIVQQMYDEIEEINTAIRSRPEGQRQPTAVEAELRRKIITSIRAVKRQVSTPELYQALRAFTKYVTARNDRHRGLDYYIEEFIAGERSAGKHAPKPADFEFGADEEETAAAAQQDDEGFNEDDLAGDPDFDMMDFIKGRMKKEHRAPLPVKGFDLSPRAPRDMNAVFEMLRKEKQKREEGNGK